ncbi:MAG: hypothetical protein A3J38_09360 [Gammaproteobacteria bacterium RIFCSPHIGHO2_12_FULL_45_9]|nr:MAG: hypothetical protein A3J38_09360 [Gammaproteobacteria bacterium RIFCSPHIGHO2_12_FULL_45_9]
MALQLVDILARLPWESLLVSLRDQHTAPIFSQRFQKQLRKDIRTQFSRVVSHWQSIAQQAIQTQPQNAVSLVRCVRLATLMNLRESLAALCQRNASAPILPVPYEWDTLLFCLRSGSVEMCLYFQRLSQLTADGGVVYDQSTLMYFLIQQRISYPCILYAISAGWLMPETLLIEAPHAFACVFEHFYLPGVKFIRLLAQYLETDPLCRDLYSIHDCICMMLLVCVKPAHVACVPTLFADEVFTAYFCELSSQHLNRLFCATLAQIDNESDCRDFLTFEARKALVLQWCVYLTENQWFNLLKTEQYPACIMQHRASGKRYPNLEQAFVRFSEEQEQEAKQKADALIAECEAEENAKSAKQKQQKKKIEQGKKKCEQYNVERVAEAKQAQAEKVRAEKIQLAQLKQAQKQERAARLAEEQRLHEAAIQAALLRVVTVEAVSVAFKTETKEAEAEVVLQDAVPVAVEPSVSADVSVALPMVSVAPPVAEVLPSMIQHVLEAVPATWPVLIPGHMDRASTEWHLWLLVPPSYAGQLSQLPMALWQWLPVAYRDTYVYAQGQAYPECRLSPYVLSDGTVIVLTMTQLSAHPEVDVAELLHPGLISLTTTRWDLKNKRWFFSTERALSDLAERKLTVLNGDKKVWDYSHETIAFSIKTCAKYCIPQQGFLFTESLRSVLESMLSIVPHAARVIWMLCEKESYFMRRPQAIWCMFWLLQNKTDDTRVIENSLRYLQHMARDIQRTRDTMERLSFWFVAYAILRRATYWDDTAQLVRETVEDAHVLTLLPTPAEKDGLAARMFTSLQHYTVFTRPEWTGTARSIPVGSSAAV